MLAVVGPALVFLVLSINKIDFGPFEVEAAQVEEVSGVERGRRLFATLGCVACHGEEGRGGVVNPNYLQGTSPTLALEAERLMLFDPEDAEIAIELLITGADLEALDADPPFRGYVRFRAQLENVRGVIRDGSAAGKLDADGPQPFSMPAWAHAMDNEQRDLVIAYLISLYDWEDY